MSIEEKVIWFDKWIDNQRRGEYPTWGTDQTEALADIIANWRKRGEALDHAWAAVRVRDESINATVKKLQAQVAALTPPQPQPAAAEPQPSTKP